MMNTSEKEILDRVKRIETRVTVLGRHMGADVGGGRPEWVGNSDGSGDIIIPTKNCSVGEMLKVIPPGKSNGHVYYDREYLFSFTILPQ